MARSDKLGAQVAAALPRLAAGGVVLLAFAFFLRPAGGWSPSYEALLALVPALVVWVGLEITVPVAKLAPVEPGSPPDQTPHPHDRALLEKFNELVDRRDRAYLREHTFHVLIHDKYLEGIEGLADGWQGADYEFHDQSVQTAFARLRAKAVAFNGLVEHLSYDDRRPEMLTLLQRTPGGARRMSAKQTEIADKLDAALKDFLTELDNFWKFARERIGITSL